MLTGLRGVGKTVLLNEVGRIAKRVGYRTVMVEAHEDKPMGPLLVPHLRQLLFALDRVAGAGDKAKRAMGVLRSFIGSLKVSVGEASFGVNVEPAIGTADSGDLEVDFTVLLVSVAEAAVERGTAVALLIDEVQFFGERPHHGDASHPAVAVATDSRRRRPADPSRLGRPVEVVRRKAVSLSGHRTVERAGRSPRAPGPGRRSGGDV